MFLNYLEFRFVRHLFVAMLSVSLRNTSWGKSATRTGLQIEDRTKVLRQDSNNRRFSTLRYRAMPEAVLFDCDGVLVDTERDGHRVAFNEAFKRNGEHTLQSFDDWILNGIALFST